MDGLTAPDLFASSAPGPCQRATIDPPAAPELVRAQALSRRMKRLKARPDKILCAHLICENLKALLSKSRRREGG